MVFSNQQFEVIGDSCIVIIDLNNPIIRKTDIGISAKHIKIHLLSDGDSFNTRAKFIRINPKRKKILKGKEYYKNYPLNTNIFGIDVIKDIITVGLIDNLKKEPVGLSFGLDNNYAGKGVKFVFKKTLNTCGVIGNDKRK